MYEYMISRLPDDWFDNHHLDTMITLQVDYFDVSVLAEAIRNEIEIKSPFNISALGREIARKLGVRMEDLFDKLAEKTKTQAQVEILKREYGDFLNSKCHST